MMVVVVFSFGFLPKVSFINRVISSCKGVDLYRYLPPVSFDILSNTDRPDNPVDLLLFDGGNGLLADIEPSSKSGCALAGFNPINVMLTINNVMHLMRRYGKEYGTRIGIRENQDIFIMYSTSGLRWLIHSIFAR